jgi:prepilin-type processing-associated H-X9-DG protein
MIEQMEPERKIEKLLRAYAKRRRGQAGDPLKLHPATRRILQDAVARNAPNPDAEDASMTLWELFRQQWAFLLGFALIIFFVATMSLPTLSSAKKRAQTIVAVNDLKQIGLAAQIAAEEDNGRLPASLDALTNQLVSEKTLTDPASGKRFIYVGGGHNLDGLWSNSVLAYSPTDKKGRAVLFADGHVEVINGARFSELTNRKSIELAVTENPARRQPAGTSAANPAAGGNIAGASGVSGELESETSRNGSTSGLLGSAASNSELAANKPAAPAATADCLAVMQRVAGKNLSVQANSNQFASTSSPKLAFSLQNSFKNTAAPAKAVAVLANFQVHQYGSKIRVVDADGSVYEGSLQPESDAVQSGLPVAATPPPPLNAPAQAERKDTIATRDDSQSAQNYFFRVRGMNQTLQQSVVFTGNLLADTSTSTNLQQTFGGGGAQMQLALTNQLPWSDSRIAGTAVIAGTNSIEINAVPLPP